jgi:hypothetical protein
VTSSARGESWNLINRFNPATCLCMFQMRTSGFQCHMCWVVCLRTRVIVPFRWYWWNCWPSVFELSFHNDQRLIRLIWFIVFNATFSNISAISWRHDQKKRIKGQIGSTSLVFNATFPNGVVLAVVVGYIIYHHY